MHSTHPTTSQLLRKAAKEILGLWLLGGLLFGCGWLACGCGDSSPRGGDAGDASAEGGTTTPTEGTVEATGLCLEDQDPNSELDPPVLVQELCVNGAVCAAAGACIPVCTSDADCDLWEGFTAKCELSKAYPELPKHCQIYCNPLNMACPPLTDDTPMACFGGPDGAETCVAYPDVP